MEEDEIRILIIDDEEGIREMFKETLKGEGYVCQTAASGEEGLAALSSGTFHIALVDIMMPRMSGLTFFQYMKDRFPDTSVIFITAMDDVSLAVRNMKEGAYDYLVKPVSVKRLLESLREAAAKRKRTLEERQKRDQAEAEKNQALEHRTRELKALNNLLQQHLTEQAAASEVYKSILEGLQRLAKNATTLAELASSRPFPSWPLPQEETPKLEIPAEKEPGPS